jgi:hypothetical protein
MINNKNKIYGLPTKRKALLIVQLCMFIILCSSPSLFSITHFESTNFVPDTLLPDSLLGDTIPKKDSVVIKSSSALESKVEYSATDSIVFDVESQVMFLYGKANVDYGEINLKAFYIEFDMDDNTLFAKGIIDSNSKYIERPSFTNDAQEFFSDSMRYNFASKKGKIYQAKTQQDDGYVHGEQIKRVSEEVYYIKNGKYTTCDHDTPHFYIDAKKLKVIQNDKIITGPAVLKIADVPTPLGLPFGLFPNKKGKSSGIIVPAPGDSPGQGFFLRGGGYYFSLSDYYDLKITGDIYSRGSWLLNANTNYKKRYRYNGILNAQYAIFKQGVEETPSYQESRNFFIRWTHNQDPKANPYGRFSANVNAGSASNFTNNINSTTRDFLTNTFQSNISYTRSMRIFGTPSSLALNASQDQNSRDSTMNVTLPGLTFNVSRFYPFKRKVRVGKPKFYEKIGASYLATFKNSLTTKIDSTLFTRNTLSKFQNGFRHSVPLNTQMTFFKYFNFVPSANYSGTGYFETYRRTWNRDSVRLETDTIQGFDYFHNWSARADVKTTIYGMYTFNSKKVKAIRHTLTPSVGYSWRPDFSDTNQFNYYDSYDQYDNENNKVRTVEYSRFAGNFGAPNSSRESNINFSLLSNIEMKAMFKKDTIMEERKVKLLDNFRLSGSYNMALDSLKLSNINFSGNTKLNKNMNINYSGVVDPYRLDFATRTRINQFEIARNDWWNTSRKVGRLTNFRLSINGRFQGGNKKDKSKAPLQRNQNQLNQNNVDVNDPILVPDEIMDYSIPWSLRISYQFQYSKPVYEPTFTNTLNFNGELKLTEKWRLATNSGYDIKTKEFTFTTLDVYRDLHCWEMHLNLIPYGSRKSYNFAIYVKPGSLEALNLKRRREWFDF